MDALALGLSANRIVSCARKSARLTARRLFLGAAIRFRFDRWTIHAPVVSRLKRREGNEIARIDGAAGRLFMVHPDSPTWMWLLVEQAAFHFGNEGDTSSYSSWQRSGNRSCVA